MTEQDIDKIPLVDPVLQREREKRRKAEEQRKLNDPSIDDLPPRGVQRGKLSKVDPRVESWQKATSPEDVTEERARKALDLDDKD